MICLGICTRGLGLNCLDITAGGKQPSCTNSWKSLLRLFATTNQISPRYCEDQNIFAIASSASKHPDAAPAQHRTYRLYSCRLYSYRLYSYRPSHFKLDPAPATPRKAKASTQKKTRARHLRNEVEHEEQRLSDVDVYCHEVFYEALGTQQGDELAATEQHIKGNAEYYVALVLMKLPMSLLT